MEISVANQMEKGLLVILCVFFYIQVPQNVAAESKMDQVFKDNEIIPDVLQEAPKNLLKVIYENGLKVDKGNELTPTQVKSQPKVEWDAKNDEYYTLIMTDPDAPSRAQPTFREFKHWLVVNIPGNNIERGEVIAAYVGSGPPKDTGLHRYIFLVYKQPGKINTDEPHVAHNSRRNRMNFKAAKFAEKYNMGCPVAGNFYQAQYDDYVPIVHQQLANEN